MRSEGSTKGREGDLDVAIAAFGFLDLRLETSDPVIYALPTASLFNKRSYKIRIHTVSVTLGTSLSLDPESVALQQFDLDSADIRIRQEKPHKAREGGL